MRAEHGNPGVFSCSPEPLNVTQKPSKDAPSIPHAKPVKSESGTRYLILSVMKKSLEDRFLSFLKFLPGSESIDSLELPTGKEESQIADYFLANRQIIVEVKTLKNDTTYKIDRILEPYGNDPSFPIVYGKCDVNKILDKLDSGEDIKARMLEKLTRPIEKAA